MATHFRFDGWVKSAVGPAVPGSQIFLCTQPANVGSDQSSLAKFVPSPLALVFSDPNGLVPVTQPIITDGFGHFNFYVLQGVYTLVVALGGKTQRVYPDQFIGFDAGPGPIRSIPLILESNGILNASQSVFNLTSLDGTVTITNDAAGTDNLLTQDEGVTAFENAPSWWGSYEGTPYAAPNAGTFGTFGTGTPNQVKFYTMRIPQPIKVTSFALRISTGVASTVSAFAIYDSAGAKLLSWDNIDSSTNNTNRAFTLAAPVILPADVYLVAMSSTSTFSTGPTTEGGCLTGGSSEPSRSWNFGAVRSGVAANPMVGGIMPATLGALATSTGLGIRIALVVMSA